ncbi:TspO and MBR-like protein [Halosimplex carlsbadense 2-9-1]|uniref:TspO and MBR-like protein n=1 Tax=Halosimplex carlsbadense 2-9-1 TaxID=797114 RepID=M0D1M3_9EURY|nr:TspO/MBR family protein [Halosimplex carlsbadense]ELZ29416.1 TspO and MBR-like protein [Halosimplex carlsbadense 2-9-1]
MAETRTIGSGGWGRERVLTIVAGVLLVNLVGAAPAVLSGPGSPWFQALAKPTIYPPSWLFGVVWTLLFTLIGVALALVWLAGESDPVGAGRDGWTPRRVALAAFAGQMVLNVAWTPAFFAAANLLAGLVVIVALWPAVVVTIWAFDRVDRRAALLLVPYLAWVTFAAVLNYRFLALN